MKNVLLVCVLTFLLQVSVAGRDPFVIVTGIAQDAGAPQIGCMSAFCKKAWKDSSIRSMVSSIAVVDPKTGQRWLFDATPDLPDQFQMVKEITRDYSNRLDGIFLTHAHIGHYTGLMYLGRESMGAKSVQVFAMPRMMKVLRDNAPWSQLVSLSNIELRPLGNQLPVELSDRLRATPFLVPHRDEFSETVGYRIETKKKSLVFIPDIDKWEKWNRKLAEVVRQNDYVFIDGTFFADGEIPRPMSEVPHPFVSETMKLLGQLSKEDKRKVHFIHFNHSNPIVQGRIEAIQEVRKAGFRVAYQGQILDL